MSFAKYNPSGVVEHSPALVDDQGRALTAGYDFLEGVTKVAMMVWNPNSLAWERATGAAGAGGGSGATASTKRVDVSSAVIYVGDATVGTAESSTGWAIKKINIDVSGNVTSVLVGTGAWANRTALSYG